MPEKRNANSFSFIEGVQSIKQTYLVVKLLLSMYGLIKAKVSEIWQAIFNPATSNFGRLKIWISIDIFANLKQAEEVLKIKWNVN